MASVAPDKRCKTASGRHRSGGGNVLAGDQMRAAVEVGQGVVVDIPVEKIAPTQFAVNYLHKQPNPHCIIR